MVDLLLLKIGLTVLVVLTVSLFAEYGGARAGALASGFPTGLALMTLFYGLQHGGDFVIASLPFVLLGFWVFHWFAGAWVLTLHWLDSRLLAPLSALVTFFLSGLLVSRVELGFVAALSMALLAVVFFHWLYGSLFASDAKIIRTPFSWRELALRVLLSVLVVLAVTKVATSFGAGYAGVFAVFPLNLLPVYLILQRRNGAAELGVLTVHFPLASLSLIAFSVSLYLLVPHFTFLIAWGLAFIAPIVVTAILARFK